MYIFIFLTKISFVGSILYIINTYKLTRKKAKNYLIFLVLTLVNDLVWIVKYRLSVNYLMIYKLELRELK